ncbi:unnamed protein product [Porites evermanni]|uniref:Uncharacterized protein n=1 Tax=Porites evermanni TaxID=104178 RepID=A0ABN8M711_9CNID|nr:unnamed protein product [Porites evermanni]
MGKHFQLASVKAICASLGPDTSRAMPLLHCFTVCDTTSCFKGKGKRSAWEAWRSYREVTDVFLYLAYKPYYHLDKEEDFGIFAHNFPTSGTVGYSVALGAAAATRLTNKCFPVESSWNQDSICPCFAVAKLPLSDRTLRLRCLSLRRGLSDMGNC